MKSQSINQFKFLIYDPPIEYLVNTHITLVEELQKCNYWAVKYT